VGGSGRRQFLGPIMSSVLEIQDWPSRYNHKSDLLIGTGLGPCVCAFVRIL